MPDKTRHTRANNAGDVLPEFINREYRVGYYLIARHSGVTGVTE
jgi:hypothetical protein